MRVVILALAGGSNGHDDNQKAQEEYLARNLPDNFDLFWCKFEPNIAVPIQNDKFILIPGKENYSGLLEKTKVAIEWLLANKDFDFLIRTNTSNYFDHYQITKILERHQKSHYFAGGVIGKWGGRLRGTLGGIMYISGAGIYLSRNVAQHISQIDLDAYREMPDDVAIGHHVLKKYPKFTEVKRNDITDHKGFRVAPQARIKSWRKYSTTQRRFNLISEIYESQDLKRIIASLKKMNGYELQVCLQERSKRYFFLKVRILLNYHLNIFHLKRRVKSL
jgi:hypothetical protein